MNTRKPLKPDQYFTSENYEQYLDRCDYYGHGNFDLKHHAPYNSIEAYFYEMAKEVLKDFYRYYGDYEANLLLANGGGHGIKHMPANDDWTFKSGLGTLHYGRWHYIEFNDGDAYLYPVLENEDRSWEVHPSDPENENN